MRPLSIMVLGVMILKELNITSIVPTSEDNGLTLKVNFDASGYVWVEGIVTTSQADFQKGQILMVRVVLKFIFLTICIFQIIQNIKKI